jgi:hypothetical protein
MNETLVCTVCDKKWQRLRARGRKPIVCPLCVIQEESDNRELLITPKVETHNTDLTSDVKNILCNVYSAYYPKDINVYKITESKPKVKWVCVHCNFEMVSVIPLTAVPLHKCSKNTSSLTELSLAK